MSADGALERAEILLGLDRLTEARRVLGALLAQHPADVRALCLLARCHQAAGEDAAMLAVAERAVAAEPDAEAPHRLRAMALLRLDRVAEAVDAAHQAVRLAPGAWPGHAALALALSRSGRPGGRRAALAAARGAVVLGPDEAGAHFVQGVVRHGFGRLVAAGRSYRRVLRLDPQHAGALENLGRIAERHSQLGTAIRLFGAAAAAAPTEVAGLAHLRRVLLQVVGLAYGTAALLGPVLLFGAFPLAWLVAAGLLAGYLAWLRWRVIRVLSPRLRAVAGSWLRTDPRLRVRLWATGLVLVTAVGVGAAAAVAGDVGAGAARGRWLLLLLGGWLAVLALTAVATRVVDGRAGRGGAEPLVDVAAPTGGGRVMFGAFRLFRSGCVLGVALFVPAVDQDTGWGVRAGVGGGALALHLGHAWLIRRRPSTGAGARMRYEPNLFAALVACWLANLVFAAAVIGLPESSRGVLDTLAVVPFVLAPIALVVQCGWLVVRARAARRSRTRSVVESR